MDRDRAYREIYENEAALTAIRTRYFEVFRRLEGRDAIRVVDAGRSPEAVAEDVFSAVRELLDRE